MYNTIVIIRNPQDPILIIKVPTFSHVSRMFSDLGFGSVAAARDQGCRCSSLRRRRRNTPRSRLHRVSELRSKTIMKPEP